MEKIIAYRVINGHVFGRNNTDIENVFFSTNIESVFNILKANDEYDMESNCVVSTQKLIVAELTNWRPPLDSEKFGWTISTDYGEVVSVEGTIREILNSEEAYDMLLKKLDFKFIEKQTNFFLAKEKIKAIKKSWIHKIRFLKVLKTYNIF